MKRILLTVIVVCGFASLQAQDVLKSKMGESYLPEAGDVAIGFDARPLLKLFSDGGAGSPGNFITSDMSIFGKYFVDQTTAYRGILRIGISSNTSTARWDSAASVKFTGALEDKMTSSSTYVTIGGGLEKRRGNSRIQGLCGGEALIMLGSGKTTYDFAIDKPGEFNTNHVDGSTGVSESKDGSLFGFALRGFVGAEIFIFPKLSLAGELGWGVSITSSGEGELIYRDFSTGSLVETTMNTGKSSSFGVDTDNANAKLALMFHF